MTVFGDTSGFIAVIVESDENHGVAASMWRLLVEQRADILTTNYVVVETVALLHRRHGVGVVRRFTDDLLPLVSVGWVDEPTHTLAIQAVNIGARRGPSLVDCVSFIVMDQRGVDLALAFDEHFRERGYKAYA